MTTLTAIKRYHRRLDSRITDAIIMPLALRCAFLHENNSQSQIIQLTGAVPTKITESMCLYVASNIYKQPPNVFTFANDWNITDRDLEKSEMRRKKEAQNLL